MSKFRFPFWVRTGLIGTALTSAVFTSLSPLPALLAAAQTEQKQDNTQTATPSAPAPMRVSSSEQQKKLSKKVEAVYPKAAYDAKVTGVINLEIIISVDGKVKEVRQIGNGDPQLVKAAEDAVKQWVYKPTQVNKMPVEVLTLVSINFKIGE